MCDLNLTDILFKVVNSVRVVTLSVIYCAFMM